MMARSSGPLREPPATSAQEGDLPYWSRPVDALVSALGSRPDGLSTQEAERILATVGPNDLHTSRPPSARRLLARQFLSPILLLLIGATALSGLLGDVLDATIIAVIICGSGLLGFWQERQAGLAMQQLLQLVKVTTTVLRDGRPTAIPMIDVVPGDVVNLRAGDLVPGDCVVLTSCALTVDEAVLTGETFPVTKEPGTCAPRSPLSQRDNSLFLGTHVASGSGTALVVSTGRETEIGAVARDLGSARTTTGFERGLTSFGILLMRVMLVLVVLILVVNLALNRPVVESALFSLALAVGLTPQLLPAIVSISLAQGARRIAKERVIVRRLDAIEDFGSMDVLCSDKTGTMTQGRIVMEGALGPAGRPSRAVAHLARVNAGLQTSMDNPIDAAVVAAVPLDDATISAIDEIPYDFERKRLSVLVRDTGWGVDPLLITKGAFEPVLAVCSRVRGDDGRLSDLAAVKGDLMKRFEELSARGLRVLGVATRTMPGVTAVSVDDEADLVFSGFLTFADPPKEGVDEILGELLRHGVSVRMLTGDNRRVAAHVAAAVGLAEGAGVTGEELDRVDDAALAEMVGTTSVFSELSPTHKERIVRAYRARGDVVGFLGDGINDAPALRAADVGISVDTAVSVAKQSAAIVLLDKDLGVLLSGIRQGRRTFANTMKYVFITTSANFGNMLSMAVAAAMLPFLPLLAAQILLINLLTDLPGTMIATDDVDEVEMARPQQWDVRLIRRYMLVFGALSSAFDLTTFAVLRLGFHSGAGEFRSAWFLGSILTEVGVLFVLRTKGPVLGSRPSGPIVWSSVLVVCLTIAIPWTPVGDAIHVIPVPLGPLIAVIVIVLAYVAATERAKGMFWRKEASRVA